MLAVVRTDRGGIVRRRLFGRSVAGKRGETAEPRHARLDPDLADRREARRFVERPDGQVDAFAFDIIEEKRRPAIAAEPPCAMRRTMKDRRLSARPDERVAGRGAERGHHIAATTEETGGRK